MDRKAFLLGLFSIGGQVLLLRELVSAFNGDELFIGTALFGWLIAVGFGAWFGGRFGGRIKPPGLFIAGAVLLPMIIIDARLTPLLMGGTMGEIIPFGKAALISIVLMLPVGVISGWLFSSITAMRTDATGAGSTTSAIVKVYLYEGIGAFVGGALISLLVGNVYSTLGMAVALSLTVAAGLVFKHEDRRTPIALLVLVLLLVATRYLVPIADKAIDSVKYESYSVEASFDTPYSHQAMLTRDSMIVLVTDNTIEASYPDPLTAENQFIPPFLYNPDAARVLYIGRTEFGVAQLAHQFANLTLIALDPRHGLIEIADQLVPDLGNGVTAYNLDDPVAFAATSAERFDVIVLNPGALDSYKSSRLLTVGFLENLKRLLTDRGIVFFPADYDTDRYLSTEKRNLIAAVYRTFAAAFDTTAIWPGEVTSFFGLADRSMCVDIDSIPARIGALAYRPQYLDEFYLRDRLDPLKTGRLQGAMVGDDKPNSIDSPILPHLQAVYRAKASGTFVPLLVEHSGWLWVIPALLLGLFARLVTGQRKERRFALFLYLTAGVVSLTLELVSFYLYQSMAGSLYSELAMMVGAFMLGLAMGTYYSRKTRLSFIAYGSPLMILAATLLFMLTFDRVTAPMLLAYHCLFQFTVAMGTGGIFVAATRRYYTDDSPANRGVGYAFEIFGSAIGALVAVTMLLPAIGLSWLLLSVCALLLLTVAGVVLTRTH